METIKCKKCNEPYVYLDNEKYICPMCSYEWDTIVKEDIKIFKDSNNTILKDGDTVSVIKDLKVKSSSLVIKQGTKVKNIKLIDEDHDINCKIDGIGSIQLKTKFVKKI